MYFIDCQDVFSSFLFFLLNTFPSIIYGRKKTIWKLVSDSSHWPNGERGIWTLAPVTRPTPLAGAPLQPLEYFSSESYYIKPFYVCQLLFRIFLIFKNVNIKFDIFSCFYRFAILHNTQPVSLYIFTFRQRNSKAATPASLSRPLFSFLCKLFYLFLE